MFLQPVVAYCQHGNKLRQPLDNHSKKCYENILCRIIYFCCFDTKTKKKQYHYLSVALGL